MSFSSSHLYSPFLAEFDFPLFFHFSPTFFSSSRIYSHPPHFPFLLLLQHGVFVSFYMNPPSFSVSPSSFYMKPTSSLLASPVSLELDVHRSRDYLGSSDLSEVLFEARRRSIDAQHPPFTACILLLHRRRREPGGEKAVGPLWLLAPILLFRGARAGSCRGGDECGKGGRDGSDERTNDIQKHNKK